MIEGSKISLIKDDRPPLQSGKTRLVAAALASNFHLFGKKALVDAIEAHEDGTQSRSVTWLFDGSKGVTFAPEFAEETIGLGEFVRRFESLEWCEANPHHPIAYMRAMSLKLDALRVQLIGMKPMVLMRKGKRTALIPAECEPSRRAEILAQMQ